MKTIALNDEIHKELSLIQIAMGLRTYEDVIHALILNYQVQKRQEVKEDERT